MKMQGVKGYRGLEELKISKTRSRNASLGLGLISTTYRVYKAFELSSSKKGIMLNFILMWQHFKLSK